MILEIMTLVLLAAVLLTKYGTTAHIIRLNQRQAELENECNQYTTQYKALMRERETAEVEEKQVFQNVQMLEYEMEELKIKLSDQEERNQELQERIEKR